MTSMGRANKVEQPELIYFKLSEDSKTIKSFDRQFYMFLAALQCKQCRSAVQLFSAFVFATRQSRTKKKYFHNIRRLTCIFMFTRKNIPGISIVGQLTQSVSPGF